MTPQKWLQARLSSLFDSKVKLVPKGKCRQAPGFLTFFCSLHCVCAMQPVCGTQVVWTQSVSSPGVALGALLCRLNLNYMMWKTRNRVVWQKTLPLSWGDEVNNTFTGPALDIIWASAHEGPFQTLSFSLLWYLIETNLKVEWMS